MLTVTKDTRDPQFPGWVFTSCQGNFMTSQPVAIIPIMTCRHQKNLNLSLLLSRPLPSSFVSRRAPAAAGNPDVQPQPDAQGSRPRLEGLLLWPGSPQPAASVPPAWGSEASRAVL